MRYEQIPEWNFMGAGLLASSDDGSMCGIGDNGFWITDNNNIPIDVVEILISEYHAAKEYKR